jgi:TRAP-type mannitol/chloroaromatic compound transport system permease small subunit
MKVLKSILKYSDKFADFIGKSVSWFLLILVAFSVYEVFTRRIMGKPTVWTHEMLGFVFAAVVLLPLGFAHLHDSHAKVDILTEKASPKTLAIIETIVFLPFLGLFCYVMLKDGITYASTSWMIRERTPSAFNVIIYPAKTLIPVGIALLSMSALSRWIKGIVFLVKGEKL